MGFKANVNVNVIDLQFVLVCLEVLGIAIATGAAREVPRYRHEFAIAAAGVEGSGGPVECWNALNELKSCTNEIVLFFVNGQTDIGPDCCRAIDVITRSCWPAMLTSLGFTPEEGNILRGYCYASSAPAVAVAAPPLSGSPRSAQLLDLV